MVCTNPHSALIFNLADGSKKVIFPKFPDNYHKYSDEELFNFSFHLPILKAHQVLLPCRKCQGCKLDYSRSWALRCVHESRLYKENCFITLTYDDLHLPSDRKLVKKDVQDFFKRLRFHLSKEGKTVRFFLVGEYGSRTKRPHYHAILFGFSPSDLVFANSRNGISVFRSNFLENCWSNGFVFVGSVTFESCAYVARYCLKKVETDPAFKEFSLMSRRPGIGKDYFNKFYLDFYNSDVCFIPNRKGLQKVKVPRYYDKLLADKDPFKLLDIKDKRIEAMSKLEWPFKDEHLDFNGNSLPLLAKEELHNRICGLLPRELE
ncbi:replication initiator protein [Capybara microvirus Cap1_SP_200]|nr:replication initiator protein [Capybara microvirus Cap1_SP_200]